MKSSSIPSATWLLFCREKLFANRLQWSCVCGSRKVEVEFSIAHAGDFCGLVGTGDLLGTKFRLEARSRSRLEGDVRDSHVPLFVGEFEHQGGASGDFTIRPRENGELMTLGLYGTPHSIRVVKVEPARVTCPLEVHGIPDVEARFENFWDAWHKPSVPKAKMPARPGWKHYAGRCISSPAYPDAMPPMMPVLATITILRTRLLVPHYMTES